MEKKKRTNTEIIQYLSKTRVPEEDQSRYVKMYSERIAQQD